MRIAEGLRAALGGHAMAEVGVATSIGVRAPDVAWCSDELREKAVAYINAGAKEAWLVFPESRRIEIDGREGQLATTAFAVDIATLIG